MIRYIYTISDKEGKIFYVGQTTNVRQRTLYHYSSKKPLGNKIREMVLNASTPIFTVVDMCDDESFFMVEQFWINKFYKEGHTLFNKRVALRKKDKVKFVIVDFTGLNSEDLRQKENWLLNGEI